MGRIIRLTVGSIASPPSFVSGVTMPEYQPALDLNGAKNIGNTGGRATYGGGSGSGASVTLSSTSPYNDLDFSDRRVSLGATGNMEFNNCRFTLDTSNFGSTSIDGFVYLLNGGTQQAVFNNCEFHLRAQRLMNCFQGRNSIFNKCVFTGGVDGVSQAGSGVGSAPANFGVELYDCWVGDHAWWRYSSTGVVHPSDDQTHNDGVQIGSTLADVLDNTFFATWPSEWVGTGTPGAGSDAGNDYVATYIVSQATMNSWRTTYMDLETRADQSFGGTSKKSSSGGSWASVMINRGNVAIRHCYFSGGGVQVNASDSALTDPVGVSIKQCTSWNDMTLGHSLTSTAKGNSIKIASDITTWDIPTTGSDRNLWFDGSTVTPAP